MFDAQKLTVETVSQVMHHMTWQYLNKLWFAAPDVLGASAQPHPAQQGPVREGIETLCRVVNEQPAHDNDTAFEVLDITQMLAEMLFTTPGASRYEIPDHFWLSELGQLIMQAQLWARGDALITASEAAMIIRGSATQRNIMYVASLAKSGKLTRYMDPDERNPQHAGRFSRAQVEALKNND